MTKAATKRATSSKPTLTQAILGYDDNGTVYFYTAEEDRRCRKDKYAEVEGYDAGCQGFPGDRLPVLALMRGGAGLWVDSCHHWFTADAKPNGWLAFDAAGAAALVRRAKVGDKIIPLGATNFAELLKEAL